EITPHEVEINTPKGKLRIENNQVLAMIGYRPNFEFLQSMGVELSQDLFIPKYNPETMESNVKGLYLAGVVCGGLETHKWFIENSRVHAEMIISDLNKNS